MAGGRRWRFITARPIATVDDLGGTEQAILHLGAALERRGHLITLGDADIAVAVNDARLLPVGARRPVVWFHNEVLVSREARRGRLPALLRHRPVAVFCGSLQARRARFLPFRDRVVLPHGLPEAILRTPAAPRPPAQHALFISQAYRGLAGIIDLWRRHIAPALPTAKLSAFIAPCDVARFERLAGGRAGIAILPRIANAAMPGLLATARLLLAPGHASETFCLSAAEAIAMGVPVVTLGLGALRERVMDGRTGFVCRSAGEMAERSLALLTDDTLWARMHAEGLATRRDAGWDGVAAKWETLIAETYG